MVHLGEGAAVLLHCDKRGSMTVKSVIMNVLAPRLQLTRD